MDIDLNTCYVDDENNVLLVINGYVEMFKRKDIALAQKITLKEITRKEEIGIKKSQILIEQEKIAEEIKIKYVKKTKNEEHFSKEVIDLYNKVIPKNFVSEYTEKLLKR